MPNKTVLKIEFDNKKAAMHFAHWLDGQGEQNYWLWMEYRESEEKGTITATQFEYFPPGIKKFCKDLTIRTQCGRLDKNEN